MGKISNYQKKNDDLELMTRKLEEYHQKCCELEKQLSTYKLNEEQNSNKIEKLTEEKEQAIKFALKLQKKLGVDPVGKFGPKTEAAVKEWQKANGLEDDGVVGDNTWNKMFGEANESVSAPAPAPVQTPASAGSINLEKLKGHVPDAVIAQIP